jgi:hypothetical protein
LLCDNLSAEANMPFKHKLSRRLALARPLSVLPLLLVTACTDASLVDSTPELTQLILTPKDVVLEPLETVQFAAYGITSAGDTLATDVTWSASGGDISTDGHFTASAEGPYVVSATSTKNGKLKDETQVEVRSPLNELIITPDSSDLTPGETLQFAAYGRRKGDSVDVAVTYTATGGTITAAALYTAGDAPGRHSVVATEHRPTYHKNNRKPKVDTAIVHIREGSQSVASVSVTPSGLAVDPHGQRRQGEHGGVLPQLYPVGLRGGGRGLRPARHHPAGLAAGVAGGTARDRGE